MLKVSYWKSGQDLQQEILADAPPAISEAVALLWILQSMESGEEAVIADWTADLATLRQQIDAAGVSGVTWEMV